MIDDDLDGMDFDDGMDDLSSGIDDEIDYDDEDSEDLLELVTEEVRQRRLQRVVRLEHSPTDDRWLLDTVVEQLELPPEQVYEMPDDYDYVDFHQII